MPRSGHRVAGMNEFRTATMNGHAKPHKGQVIRTERQRRAEAGGTLADIAIPRVEKRTADHRHENRFQGLVDRATLIFQGKRQLVRIVNVSESGVMVETSIKPRIGETV